jgi:antitoxin VapB
MAATKVFRSGNSQAVRIPKQFQLDTDEVDIFQRGEELVLRKRAKNLGEAFALLTALSPDFYKHGRKQPKARKRPAL